MEEALHQRILAAVKKELKLSDDLDYKVSRIIRQIISRILDFCNRTDFPPQLEDMAISITEDMLKADGTVKTENEITSISRGDTTIAYKNTETSNSGKIPSSVDFVKDFEKELVKYKKFKNMR